MRDLVGVCPGLAHGLNLTRASSLISCVREISRTVSGRVPQTTRWKVSRSALPGVSYKQRLVIAAYQHNSHLYAL